MRIRQNVITVVSQLDAEGDNCRVKLSIILQKTAYRPAAFTTWKFFYVTRNFFLTVRLPDGLKWHGVGIVDFADIHSSCFVRADTGSVGWQANGDAGSDVQCYILIVHAHAAVAYGTVTRPFVMEQLFRFKPRASKALFISHY